VTGDKLLVTGATGNVGGALLRQLQRAGANVRAVVRDRSRLTGDADVAVADLGDPASLTRAATGVRAAFVLAGGHDVASVLTALRSAGVEHVVVLTSRSVIGRVPGNAIADMWATAEAAVTGSGLGFTVLRPSGFASNALRWLPQLRAGDAVRTPFADAPIAVIDPADIAAVAARALVDRSLASQHLELSGPAPQRPAEQLAILGGLLGRDLRLIPLTGDASRADLAATFPPAFVDAQLRFFDGGEFDDSRVVSTVSDLLGRPARTFAEWATANAAAFMS
jgi:uncharacterized protein YbjT (DUF2867 family)